MGRETTLTRRAALAALLAPLAMAACSQDGPPGSARVKSVVEAHLERLRRKFVAGDYDGIPGDVLATLDPAERERARVLAAKAELVSFSSDVFIRQPDGSWRGNVVFDVTVPIPGAPYALSARYRTTGDAFLRRAGGAWWMAKFGTLRTERTGGQLFAI